MDATFLGGFQYSGHKSFTMVAHFRYSLVSMKTNAESVEVLKKYIFEPGLGHTY